jgi:hypothetical protein
MEWMTAAGQEVPEEQRQTCQTTYMSAPSAIRVGVLPVLLIIALAAGVFMVVGGVGMGEIKVAAPALIIILCSFFMLFSQNWSYALLLTLGALLAIGAQASNSGYRFHVSLFGQLIIFAIYLGGLGFGSFFVDSAPNFFPNLSGSNNPDTWGVVINCKNYYGTFDRFDQIPWDSSGRYDGYCDAMWIGALNFFQAVVVMAYFIMIVATGTLLAEGGK